jgi:hypothetical protein
MDYITGFFTDHLTGQECATVKRNGEEICITADEAYDILAKQQAEHDDYELMCEIG